MSDTFTSLDIVLYGAAPRRDSDALDSAALFVNSQSVESSTIVPQLSSISVDEINDLPVDFERRTQGGNGLTFWCVIA
uniref:Pheromone Phb3 B5 n=1 Tax=Coprinopsis cinerea TaxID=5346 RepID=Q6TMB4_COPCI|nr:pheromone precursor Phb3 B5 [Coprinopsis cinerea]